jgi:hypothetical protein
MTIARVGTSSPKRETERVVTTRSEPTRTETKAPKAELKAKAETGHSTKDVFEVAPRTTRHASGPAQPHSAGGAHPHDGGVHPHDGGDEPVGGPGGSGAPPAGGEHHHTPAEARKAGEEIVESNTHWRWLPPGHKTDTVAVTNDILEIARDPSHTEAEKSAILKGALDELSSEDRKKVAASLSDYYKNDLPQFSRAGLEALKGALGTGSDTQAARESLQRELDSRPPMRQVVVNGVTIMGEVSQEAIDAAAAEVRRLTENPEVAGSMTDYTIIITPRGKRATDVDAVYEKLGLHGQEVGGQPGRIWDTVSGGAGGRTLYFNEDDAVKPDGTPGSLNTLNQEFGHAVKFNHTNNLKADDPRLTALLAPGTKVTDVDGDGKVSGADTLKIAYQQRLADDNINADYAKLNQEEWFSLAAAAFNGPEGSSHFGGAQWLYDNDRATYNLMEDLFGPTRQDIVTDEERKAATKKAA